MVTVDGRPGPSEGWRIEVRRRRRDTVDVLHAVVTAYRHGHLRLAARTRVGPLRTDEDRRCGPPPHWALGRGAGTPAGAPAGADRFPFHPALFEAGLLGGSVDSHMLHDTALFLPLVIESFRASAPLGRHCFVRVAAASASRDEELIRLVAEFYGTTGVKVAEVGPVVAKRSGMWPPSTSGNRRSRPRSSPRFRTPPRAALRPRAGGRSWPCCGNGGGAPRCARGRSRREHRLLECRRRVLYQPLNILPRGSHP
ncbi:hypothetical protein KIPE111705_06890 [Kibdelosporangium persicum]